MANVDSYINSLTDLTEDEPTYSGGNRNISTELGDVVDANSVYGDALTRQSLKQLNEANAALVYLDASNQTQGRAAEITDIATLGGSMRQALLDTTPELKTLTDWAGSTGASTLETELTAQAEADLALGRTLSNEQIRAATQQSRAGMSARGLGVGTGALAAEVLNRDAYATEREANRRIFATSIEGLNQDRISNDRTFVSNVATTMDSQTRLGNAKTVDPTSAYESVYTDDLLAYASNLNSSNASTSLGAYTAELEAYQDNLSTLGSYYNSLINADASAANSAANSSASSSSAYISAGASIIGTAATLL